MTELSDDQKESILNIFKENPNIIEITKKVFNDDKLDGRSKEGRAVSKFLAENGLKAKTTKRAKSENINLSQDQIDEILEMCEDGMNTSQIADLLFDKEVKRLSNEWRAVNEIVNQKSEEEKDEGQDSSGRYIPPQAISRIIKKINDSTGYGLEEDKMSRNQKHCCDKLRINLSNSRFVAIVNNYTNPRDKELFEQEFVRLTWDKPDLTADELNLYMNVAKEIINLELITGHLQKLNDMFLKDNLHIFPLSHDNDRTDKINLNEHSKFRVKQIISESRGLYGRLLGDKFKRQDTEIEFQDITNYPEIGKFEDADKRDEAIAQLETQLSSQIEWMNIPNNGSLGFAIATFTNTQNNENIYWGRYFREITPNMMGKWSNKEVPAGWQLQHNTALKMEAGLDPQHLIVIGKGGGNTSEVINLIKENGGDNPVIPKLIGALEQLSNGNMPNFENEREQLPAIRDYFGEIMGPIAFRGGLDINGDSEIARKELLDGANWNDCQIRWPQEMNYALVDSIFKGPNGAEVGISSKGGAGASAGVTNIAKAMLRANDELLQTHSKAVDIINIINDNTALNGPFRLAEYLGFLPQGLEEEINSYIKQVKKDFKGISKGANELISGAYGELQDPDKVPGFNTGFALMSKLAKKITMHINTNIPEFSDGCLAFLNQSAIVQLYCKMGVKGPDTYVAEWRSVYPPNFEGRILLDSGKTYYSSRIGSKFTFKLL